MQEKKFCDVAKIELPEENEESPSKIKENDQIEGQKNLEEYFDENGNYEEPEENDESPSKIKEKEKLEGQKNIEEYFDVDKNYELPKENDESPSKIKEKEEIESLKKEIKENVEERCQVPEDKIVSLTRENGEIYWKENGITIMHESGDGVISSMADLVGQSLVKGCTVEIVIRG